MHSTAFSGSVKNGSRELYASTNFSVTAPNGCYIKIGNNEIFYQAESYRTLSLKKKFKAFGDRIVIKGDYSSQISEGDSAKLYFPEKELVHVKKIKVNKKDSIFGEIFTLKGGSLSSSQQNLTGSAAKIKVTAVNKEKEIKETLIYEGGGYLTPPENPVTAVNESGHEIQVELEFDDAAESGTFERDFRLVSFKDGATTLDMSYVLPKPISEGEMILSKTVILLEKEYRGKTVVNAPCQTSSDFSPINNIPLMPPNCIAPHAVYNKAIEVIDKRLQEINLEIAKLKQNG
jgi:hypothetical protein